MKTTSQLVFLLLVLVGSACGQQTTVTGAVTDPVGNLYAGGALTAFIRCPGNAQPYLGAVPLNRTVSLPFLDGNGRFSTVLYDVNFINTGPGTATGRCAYAFEVTDRCGVSSFTTGNIGGATQTPAITDLGPVDLSASISSFALSISPKCLPGFNSGASIGNDDFGGTNTYAGMETFNAGVGVNGSLTAHNQSTMGNNVWVCPSSTCPYQSIASGYAALPSCTVSNILNPFRNPPATYQNFTWSHCGTIFLAAGTYTSSTPTNITSPVVRIVGDANLNTVLSYTGTSGCYLYWTAIPFNYEFNQTPLLENVLIDGGQSNAAGTCGLNTDNIASFHARNVHIQNFSGSGSVCWNNTVNLGPAGSEKYDVEIFTANCNVHWQVYKNAAGGNNTFGYGRFSVKSVVFAGQTGLLVDGGTCTGQLCGGIGFQNSMIHFIVNEVSNPANSTALLLRNGAQMSNNNIVIHMECPYGMGTGREVSIDSSSNFSAAGTLDTGGQSSWSVAGSLTICGPTGSAMSINGNGNGSSCNYSLLSTMPTGDLTQFQSLTNQTFAKTSGWIYNIRGITNYSGTGANKGNAFGVFGTAILTGTGSMVADGVGSQIGATASGTVSLGKAFYALSPNIFGGGAVQNAYGLVIDEQKVSGVANGYGIYQSGSKDVNYFAGPIQIGGSGSRINTILSGSATLTYTSIAANTCQEQTLTVNDATSGKAAFFSPGASLGNTNLSWSSWVSSNGTVSVRVCNHTTGAITPNAVSWNGWVQQ